MVVLLCAAALVAAENLFILIGIGDIALHTSTIHIIADILVAQIE